MTLIKFPCKDDKSPAVGGWKTYKGAVDSAVVGYMIPDGVIVLDLDTYKDVTCADVEAVLGCELLWHEAELQKTRNGGKHYAFRIPNGCQLRQGSDLFGVKGFDTRASGKGYIASGKGYEDLTLFGIDETLSDPDCLPELGEEALATLDIGFEVVEDDDFGLEEALNNERLGLGADELRAYVEALPDSMAGSGGDWLDIGMGIYHETGGSEDGWELFDEFSRRDAAAYDEGQNRKRWESWDNQGKRAVTFATVIKKAGGKGVIAQDISANLIDQIKVADEEALQSDDLVKKIKSATLDNIGREMIVQAYQGRFKELLGVKLPVGDVRKLLSKSRDISGGTTKKPSWLLGWVYCETAMEFINIELDYSIKREAFNAKYDREIECEMAEIPASQYALNTVKIPTIVDTLYWPGANTLFDCEGKAMLNIYRDRGIVPIEPEGGSEIVGLFNKHLELTFDDVGDRTIFLDWLSYVCQNPGQRINWAVLLQGTQGTGKTYFYDVLQTLLGSNARLISNGDFTGRFTGWAYGSTVVAVEEIKVKGEFKYEMLDKMKPFITNKMVAIEEKGRDQRTVPNFSSYFLLTNHKDAIPINDGDRRYCVLYSRWQSEEQMFSELGGELAAQKYYEDLYDALESDQAGELAWFLKNRKISESFSPRGRAPKTRAKQEMIDLSISPERQALDDAISEHECEIINSKVIDITWLRDLCKMGDIELPKPRPLSAILLEMGYQPYKKRKVKIQSTRRNHYIWLRNYDDKRPIGGLVRSFHSDSEIPF